MKIKLKDIESLLKKGLIQIFSANVINKFAQFGTLALLARILTKSDYGAFSYAQNIMSFALLLEGAGVTTGILQYCSISKDSNEKQKYLKFGLKFGVMFNVILSIAMLLYGIFGKIAVEDSRPYVILLSMIPLLSVVYNSIQSYLRSALRNTEYSILTTFNTIIYLILSVSLSYILGVNGLILGMYLSYLLTVLLGVWYIRKDLFKRKNKSEDSNENEGNSDIDRIKFLKYSIITVVTNAMSQILYLLDTQLIGIFVRDEAVLASYKIATTIPFNIVFIPLSLMTFVYPYFAQNRNDKKWIKERTKQITYGLMAVNLVITIGAVSLSKIIIPIIFGKQYMDAVPCFNILMIGYLISGSFRIPFGNILASLGLVRANLINAVLTGIANIILDIILIMKYGSIGAAYATLLVFIISSIIHFIFIRRALK